MMDEIYLVAWTGGDEVPQYQVFHRLREAATVALAWREEGDEGVDTIDVLRINTKTLELEGIPASEVVAAVKQRSVDRPTDAEMNEIMDRPRQSPLRIPPTRPRIPWREEDA